MISVKNWVRWYITRQFWKSLKIEQNLKNGPMAIWSQSESFQNSKKLCLLYSPRCLVSENRKNNAKTLKIESASSLKAALSVRSENYVQLCDPITFESLNEFPICLLFQPPQFLLNKMSYSSDKSVHWLLRTNQKTTMDFCIAIFGFSNDPLKLPERIFS